MVPIHIIATVTKMSGMFRGADKFNGDLSSWDISFVIDMGEMF